MALWSQVSNTTLGTLVEQRTVKIPLPVLNRASVSIISGSLPPGLRLNTNNNNIEGTPYEVARDVEFKFVLRAVLDKTLEDRTYSITITGPDAPRWVTPAGDLAVGENNTFYILDSSPIDFQLLATDDDIEAGQTLSYYIKEGDGTLPPGIDLTEDGRLVGIVDPLLAIERGEIYSAGTYDTGPYDLSSGGYDFGIRSSNGYDSFYYDTATWDFSYTEIPPKKLNRYYQFIVSVTDGDSVSRRTFKIFVVGDDFLRADNTILQVSNGVFSADNTNIRTPIWITPSDLGVKRSNNYVTIPLDVIDTNTLTGFINYTLQDTNYGTYRLKSTGEIIKNGRYEISGELPNFIDSGRGPNTYIGNVFNPVQPNEWEVIEPETLSALPPGIDLDTSTGDIAGRIPYQSTVSETYTFSIKAIRYTPDQQDETASSVKKFTLTLLGEIDSQTSWITEPDLGILPSNGISVLRVEAKTNVPDALVLYSLSSGRLPPGLQLSFDGEIVGSVNTFGQNIYRSIWKSNRNYKAGDVVKYNNLLYQAVSDHLSSSLFDSDNSLWVDYVYSRSGLTIFDRDNFTLDSTETSIDRIYTFSVLAQDQYNYSKVTREFTIKVLDPEVTKYSNVSLKPFMNLDIRQEFNNFISDPEIFIPQNIYRPNDPFFGIQRDIKIPVYYGIESRQMEEFVAAAAKNHKRKTYKVGELKTALAKVPGSDEVVYEVIYVEIVDPQDVKLGSRTQKSFTITNADTIKADIVSRDVNNSFYDYDEEPSFIIQTRNGAKSVTLGEDFEIETRNDGIVEINWFNDIVIDTRTESNILNIFSGIGPNYKIDPKYTNVIKADSDVINVSANKDNVRYISNINNMRDNIRELGKTNRNFVPLWMRTSQNNSVNELGYTPAIVLCYCKPGTSNEIQAAIKASNFDFSIFNLDIDRYVIDSSAETSESKYLVFQNYRFNV